MSEDAAHRPPPPPPFARAQPYGSYGPTGPQPPSAPPPNAKPVKKPSVLGYVIAGVLALVSGTGMVWVIVASAGNFADQLAIQSFQAPGQTTFHAPEAGSYTSYARTGQTRQHGIMQVTSNTMPRQMDYSAVREDTGEQLNVVGSMGTNLNVNNRHYTSVAQFRVDQPGDVVISADLPEGSSITGPGQELAIGKTVQFGKAFGAVGKVLLAILIGLVGIGGAAGIFVVTLIKRIKANRRASASV